MKNIAKKNQRDEKTKTTIEDLKNKISTVWKE